jgi:5-methylcytosine-specific restriction endonuclease McrA
MYNQQTPMRTHRGRVAKSVRRDTYNQPDKKWKELRQEIIKRDGCRCVKCGEYLFGKVKQVDHVQMLSRGGRTVKTNLRTLCLQCHAKRPDHEAIKRQLKKSLNSGNASSRPNGGASSRAEAVRKKRYWAIKRAIAARN